MRRDFPLGVPVLCLWAALSIPAPATVSPKPCADPGAEQRVGGLRVVLVGGSPTPAATGPNLWTVRIEGRNGKPLAGAAVALRPFMEAHGHGTVPDHFQGEEEAPGRYRLGPFDLFMPGDWRMEIRVAPRRGRPAAAVFHACIQE